LRGGRIKYAIRLPANQVLQNRTGYLLKRPVGRPPNEVRRYYANFTYQAASWTKPRPVIAKVEWHPGERYPRVGFIVTNLARPTERVVAFCNKRGTCEQWIKEGKGAIKWTRLSCRTFAANAVRLQLHALAYNLGNFLRTLATPEPIKDWFRTSLKEKLIKIGANVVSHGRYVAFQMAEVALPRQMFQEILRQIAELLNLFPRPAHPGWPVARGKIDADAETRQSGFSLKALPGPAWECVHRGARLVGSLAVNEDVASHRRSACRRPPATASSDHIVRGGINNRF
jgi:hypothetical protein